MPESDQVTAGLSSADAAARLARDGPNRLPPPKRRPAWRRLGHQLTHFFALMLWCAAGLALLARLPELAVAITVVVVLNALFAFAQESRAARTAERLGELLPMRVRVQRDGRRVEVDAAEVVTGDVLLLEPGDRIPADGALLAAAGFKVDTSLLSGESEPASLDPGDRVLAGTFVVEGEGRALVDATGARTRLAAIAALTAADAPTPSPLARELRGVVRTISTIALGVGGAFFALSLSLGNPPGEGFVFAIGVTVALVPEALLPTITLALAWGAEQMAHRQVLVRNLEAVETLGATTFICTDKTGTLTINEMTVVEAWTPLGSATVSTPGYDPDAAAIVPDPAARPALEALAAAAERCSVGHAVLVEGRWRAHGDPMEAAIDVFARRLGLRTAAGRVHGAGVVRFPFDPRRRRTSAVVDGRVYVKGAPDSVLPLCRDGGGAEPALARLTGRGLRVLAVAARAVTGPVPASAEEAERDLELLGLLAMQDPPRPDARNALATCRRAGIKLAMVTGDHPVTAAAIATEVGLRTPSAPVLTGGELPSDDRELAALLDRDGVVVARVSPEQKLRIARALRGAGHVVAMTGDGVNDGPALHEADIGIAMGRAGTDVAREAADLVLLDDHVASIVQGIEQGRATFFNIRRFLTYHLTDNVAELTPFLVWALSGGRFPLALGVLQILALDIGTDTLSAVALGAEPPGPKTLDRPPVSGRLLDRTVARRAFGLLGPTVAAATMAAFTGSLLAAGWRPGGPAPDSTLLAAASGAAFLAVVLGQSANAFACRSATRTPWHLSWRGNRLLPWAVAAELALSLALVLVPAVARQLGQAAPSLTGWALAVLAAPAVLLVDATAKRRDRRRQATATPGARRAS